MLNGATVDLADIKAMHRQEAVRRALELAAGVCWRINNDLDPGHERLEKILRDLGYNTTEELCNEKNKKK